MLSTKICAILLASWECESFTPLAKVDARNQNETFSFLGPKKPNAILSEGSQHCSVSLVHAFWSAVLYFLHILHIYGSSPFHPCPGSLLLQNALRCRLTEDATFLFSLSLTCRTPSSTLVLHSFFLDPSATQWGLRTGLICYRPRPAILYLPLGLGVRKLEST